MWAFVIPEGQQLVGHKTMYYYDQNKEIPLKSYPVVYGSDVPCNHKDAYYFK
eukprot:CAMPEP_0114551024 /NCGR_PEP_ID=MMETSP0114-20121206/6384_1 /TAXON_ID=31324 /ORGANISM="Goniomonas sp, Strain m" /LENGTH=51 /DNA_ID=CAMNT_0001735833 /DNA_START=35 /DNA_END=190 /DNA_ORIENTATION=+